MSSSGPNSLGGVLSNPQLLSALYPNLNLSGLSQYYTSEQSAMEAPIQQITTQLQQITSESTAWQTINSAVSTLQQDFQTLSQLSTWQSTGASSSLTSVATASAGSGATTGTYIVQVNQLGQPEVLTSSSTYASPTTALNLAAQTDTINGASIQITSSDTLDSIAQKINQANAGVTAAVVDANGTYQLSLSTTADASITYSGTDLFGTTSQGLAMNVGSPVQSAKAWQYSVNGVTTSSTSNTDTTSVSGLTLNLVGTGTTTIAVSSSSSAVQSALKQIATDYNALQSTIAQYTGKGAVLAGNATAEGIMSQLNRQLFSYDTSLPVGYQTVADAGLTLKLNADKTTTLTFSSSTFQSAYASNPSAVQSLLSGANGDGGLSSTLGTTLSSLSASGTGVIASILNSYQQQIQQLQQSEQSEQGLVTMQQQALGAQFNQEINALLSLMGQQQTVTALVNQLDGQSSSSSSSSSSSGG